MTARPPVSRVARGRKINRREKRIRCRSACSLFLWLALARLACADPVLPTIPPGNFNVVDYGASGDGVSDNTTAIQDALDDAGGSGGGTVEIPAGTYLCGPLTLANNINLQIDSGATLQELPLAAFINYPPQDQTYGNLIYAKNVTDIEISGSGTIDGQGPGWWTAPSSVFSNRPYMVFFNGGCQRVWIHGVTLQNPPKMHVVFKGVDSDITVDGITINTPPSPNTDGIDLVGTSCLVRNSTINAGDDNIAIGSSSSSAVSTDILITNCTFGIGHGVSIGSNTRGGVSNMTVTSCSFNGTDYGIRMKSDNAPTGGNGNGGVAQNLTYSNITMTNIVYGAIVLYSYYNEYGTPIGIDPSTAAAQPVGPYPFPVWSNIAISNVSAVVTGQFAGIIWGRIEVPFTNVVFQNVNITAPSTFDIYNAQGVQFIDSQITAPAANTFNLYNAQVTVTNSAPNTNLVTLGGLAIPPANNVLAFFNTAAAVTDTNLLGTGSITLGDSALTFTQDSVSFSDNLAIAVASTLGFTSGTNTFSGVLSGSDLLTLALPANSLLTLANDSSGFSGGVTVTNGTLLVSNPTGSGTGSGAVSIHGAATLGGNGFIGGPVTVDGTFAPGRALDNSTGTLTIDNDLALDAGATFNYALGINSDLAVVTGDLTLGGTLNVTDAGGFTSATYTLFTYGGALIDNGVTVSAAPAGYSYVIDTNTPGLVNLIVTSLLPSPPSGLTATTVATNQINLSWTDNANGEDGFLIERAPDNGGNPGTWAQIASVGTNVTTYSDVGLSPLTTYWYRVRAYNVWGDSNYSNQAGATTLPLPPQAPSNLTATTVSTNQINLSWTDTANDENGFLIERAPDNGGVPGAWAQIASVGTNVTTYNDIGLASNTTYWYRVRAYNAGGDSDYSNQASATTLLLMAPSGLTATAISTNQINLSWTDNSSNEDGFEIDRAPDNGGSPGTWAQVATVGTDVTTYSDTGLSPNTTYWYRVRAYNAAGDSSYSNQASATTLPPPPQAPSGLTATTVSSSQINLSWADNSNNESGFKIERSTDGINFAQIAQVLPNTTSYRNTGLALGTTYFYRVRAYNSTGNSDFSNVASATTLTLCSSSVVFAWGNYYNSITNVPPGLTNVVAIAAGLQHSLALRSNGTVVGWGLNSYGQTNSPAGLTNAVAVAAGGYHSLALRSNGTVVGWGYNTYGQTNSPAGLTNAVAISAGYYHSLALKSDGTVVGWGYNGTGAVNVPSSLSGVVAVAAGFYHSLALKSDGTVVGWGSYGQLPPGLTNVVAIAAGNSFSLALKSDGTAVGWGQNSFGQATVPPGLSNVVAIAAGDFHSLALKSDGTVVGWGENYYGETNVPPAVAGVAAIGAGDEYSLVLMCGAGTPSALVATAVSANQINLSWTDNRLGNGFKIERSTDGINFAQIAQVLTSTTTYRNTGLAPGSTYYYRVCAYTSGGNSDYSNVANASTPALCVVSVAGWGNNSYGQTTPPTNLTGVVAIAGGYYHSLALIGNGTVVGWGNNSNGQTNSPAGLTNAVAIAAGGNHSLALRSDGTVVGWGDNGSGQTNSPAGLTNAVAVAAGYYHSLALRSDGTVVGWGDNITGATNVPPGLIGVVAIAAGFRHSLALRSDGTVIGWGLNNAGQTNVPSNVTNAVAIAAGYYSSLALRNNGTIVSWGNSGPPPSGPTNVVAIAAGNSYSLALRSDGTVVGWGNDSNGQTDSPAGLTNVMAIAAGGLHSLAMTCGPNAPSALVATAVSANQINLSWTDNFGDANRFGIERATSSTGPWAEIGTVDSTVTTYSDTGVGCGQPYYYGICAYNAVAGSPYSNIATADTSTVDTDGDGIPDCWMLQYFGHPTGQSNDNSLATDDPDGTGFTVLQDYLVGLDPTNNASSFRIISIVPSGIDLLVTWTMGSGKTNALQATGGDATGNYSSDNFTDIFTVTNTVGTTTNYLDTGATTNFPARYYRVRLVP
ncbi:MAG: fibronectin type III domain-containing protein [Verrucomicrobiia bacterium]